MTAIRRLRYSIARWLLRPEAARIEAHYRRIAADSDASVDARHTALLMAAGAFYVGNGWEG